MTKEEILKKSREENSGKYDEREISIIGSASRIGMAVGGLLCVILAIISEFLLNMPKLGLAGWMIFLAMQGSNHLVLYKFLKKE